MPTLSSVHQTNPQPLEIPATEKQQKTITFLKKKEIANETPKTNKQAMSVFSLDVSAYNGSYDIPKIMTYKQSARASDG